MISARGKTSGSWLVERLPLAAAAALTVLVAYNLAVLTWRVAAPAPKARAELATRASLQGYTPQQRPEYAAQIASLHVFGQALEAPAPQVLDAPETRLNLTLRGVYATGDEFALAIIDTGPGSEKFYRVGDVIAGGTTLKAVYRDRVILENNQRMETLRLPKGEARGLSLTAANTATAGGVSEISSMTDNTYAYDQAAYDGAALGATATGVDLGQLREHILQNPGRLADMLMATPVNAGGAFRGYRLTPQGNTQLFSQLGLQEGDIVTAVNGISIDRPDKGLLALQDLINAEQVSVTLLRNGAEITLEHSLR